MERLTNYITAASKHLPMYKMILLSDLKQQNVSYDLSTHLSLVLHLYVSELGQH